MRRKDVVVVLSGRHEQPDETPARLAYAQQFGLPLQVYGQNTKDEVEQAIQLATDRLTFVTSQYHVPRVLLTAVAALQRAGKDRQLRVLVRGCPSPHAGKVAQEREKIAAYQATGDCASELALLDYLRWRDGDAA